MDAIDLTTRESGLLPLWIIPLAGLVWAAALAYAWRVRKRFPEAAGDLAAAGGLLVAHLLFFWRPLLTPAQVPRGGGDLNSFFFPLHAFAASRISEGDIPLWSPHLHAGMPHLANYQTALLYPPNLLAYLVARPFSYGTLELLVLLHYLIASVGAFALARTLGLARFPSLTAGIVFAYSGFFVAHLGHYSMISAAAWLPLLLLAIRMMVLEASWGWAAMSALTVFLTAAGGHQQTLLYALVLAGAWWAFWVAREFRLHRRDGWQLIYEHYPRPWYVLGDLGRFALAIAAGIGLAAPMILPSLQLARRSVRAAISYEESTAFSIQPIALVQFLLPKIFGSNPTDYWGPFSSGEIWGYVGIATLVLAAIGLAVRPTPVRIFLAAASVLALLYTLGPWTPVHGWAFRFVPLFDLVRAPARSYLILDLCLALLAAFGMQEIMYAALRESRVAQVLRTTMRVLIAALAALMLFVLPLFYSLVLGVNDPSNRPVIAIDNMTLLVLYTGATLVLLWAALQGHIRGATFAGLALLLIIIDLFGATSTFNPTDDNLIAGFQAGEAVAFLRQQQEQSEPFRIDVATSRLQPDLAAVTGLQDIGGLFDPMQLAEYTAVRESAQRDRSQPLYDMLNARYLILDDEADAPGPGFAEVLTTADGITIWENEGWMPRTWLTWEATQADLTAAMDAVRTPGFNPHETLYLTGEIPPAESGGTGEVRVTYYQPDELRLTVETDRPAYLVLADVAYPGWHAEVNGESASIATANGVFRAVTVPAGEHVVTLQFTPTPLWPSLGIAGIALVVVIGLLARGLLPRRIDQTP